MHTNQKSPAKPNWKPLVWLIVTVAAVAVVLFCAMVVYPFLLGITDNDGIFTLTFSPADLDLDGDLDVLVHNRRNPGEFEVYAGGTLWINQGGAQGGQVGRFVYQRNDIEGGLASTTAELNGDGEPGLLIFDGNRLIQGLNRGEGLWVEGGYFGQSDLIAAPLEQRQKFGQASQYATLLTGDIDQNGRVDALVLGCCGRAFKVNDEYPDIPNFSWIWFNNETVVERVAGEVASLDALEGMPVGDAALADLDGDGDLDLFAVILSTPEGLPSNPGGIILLNDGTGHFRDSGQHLGGKGSTSVALGDLDGDGDADALLGTDHGTQLWINQAGAFSASDYALTGDQTRNVVLADLDGDADLDALVAGNRRATLWWNDGEGRFTKASQSFHCSKRQNLTTGDFNGDGWQDIFIARYDKTSQVWFNNGKGGFRTSP
jgi:hypothetical protein